MVEDTFTEYKTHKERILEVIADRNNRLGHNSWITPYKLRQLLAEAYPEIDSYQTTLASRILNSYLKQLCKDGYLLRADKPESAKHHRFGTLHTKQPQLEKYVYKLSGKPYKRVLRLNHLKGSKDYDRAYRIYCENKYLPKWFRQLMN